jgi:hypothetical protein
MVVDREPGAVMTPEAEFGVNCTACGQIELAARSSVSTCRPKLWNHVGQTLTTDDLIDLMLSIAVFETTGA